jgi:beta-galactosidase
MKTIAVGMYHFYLVALLLLSATTAFAASTAPAGTRQQTDLSGTGWTAWLDKSASWQNDSAYPNGVNISTYPVHAPTVGWTQLFANSIPWQNVGSNSSAVLQVNVPGTVDEYFWGANGGEYRGVSWWGRSFTLTAWSGKRVKLIVENARLRCEVFVNQKLVGYDCVGNLPFESDITNALVSGTNQLAIRITNPGGNYHWEDRGAPVVWGNQKVLLSHGFAGITGHVFLVVEDPVAIRDIYVKNKPAITEVDAVTTITNEGTSAWSGSMAIDVMTNDAVPVSVYSTTISGLSLAAGAGTVVTKTISVPGAKVWDIGKGNLYFIKAVLKDGGGTDQDGFMQRFGFRWFEVVNHVGSSGQAANTMFRLNGKRIFILSAISWGFFPANGMYATPAIAAAQIDAAQKLGLNMLNFHRCIGQTIIFDLADEKGLLYYEEVGGYESYYNKGCSPPAGYTGVGCPAYTGRLQAREKILRMVRRDRSHPSLIHYNMQNEADNDPIDEAKQDMRDAHALDPSRTITYSSGFMGNGSAGNNKLHMIMNDSTTQYTYGFSDEHNTYNPGSYAETCYVSPTNYFRNTTCSNELTFLGEESSVSMLPRLQKLHDYYSNAANPKGWDGNDYLDWYNGFTNYISSKGLQTYYPSLDSFTISCGNIGYYLQGRVIENARMNNYRDGYAINGWECMKSDNHSGVVDQLRNLKGEARYITDYTRPLYIAVKVRHKIAHTGDQAMADLFIVNENALAAGTYTLTLTVLKPSGAVAQVYSGSVRVTGGDTFGELLAQAIAFNLDGGAGYYRLKAKLLSGSTQVADGHEDILTVDWKSMTVPSTGAIASDNAALTAFLNTTKGLNLPQFSTGLGTLKYIVTTGTGNFTKSDLLSRVNTDGTTLIIVDNANTWMSTLTSSGVVTGSVGTMTQSQNWVGGGYFVRRHPMFNYLPVNCAMNWEYQNFVSYYLANGKQYGFQMSGEEPVVTDWDNHEHRLCTSVGILTYGKGKIIFSALDIVDYLALSTGASNIPKKVLLNYLAWGANPTVTTFYPVVNPVDTSTAVGAGTSGAALQVAMNLGVSVIQGTRGVTIQYSIPPGYESVALRICDIAGKTVWTYKGASSTKGRYSISWNPDIIASGTYVAQIRAQGADHAHYSVKFSKFILMSR